jgi:Holliday junction resolvase RusA-like endonuclease
VSEPIEIVLRGETVPSGRPRFAAKLTKGGKPFAHAYTPQKTRDFQHDLKRRAQDVMGNRPPLEGPLLVHLRVYLPIPASLSARRRELAIAGLIFPAKRPDLDNYIKQLDALNQLVWRDDSQIVQLEASKLFAEIPRIEIAIDELPRHDRPSESDPLFKPPQF